jgi:hypothetical protein
MGTTTWVSAMALVLEKKWMEKQNGDSNILKLKF